jgi:hypothetical protein
LKNVPDIQSVIDSYSSGASSFSNSVDTVSLKLQITSSGNSLNSDFKESLVQDVLNSLNSFESTKNSLPQLHSIAQDMRSFNGTISQTASSITSNQNQITSYESSFLSGSLSDTLKEVDKFTSLDPSFESTATGMFQTICDAQSTVLGTVNDALGQGQSFINQAKTSINSYSTYPNKYDSYKASYSNQANEYTGSSSAGAILSSCAAGTVVSGSAASVHMGGGP